MMVAPRSAVTCIERATMPDELKDFDACFMVGTAVEVTPIASIGDLTFTPGRMCETLILNYMAVVQPGKAAAE